MIACLALLLALKVAVVMQLRDHPLLQPDAGLDTTAYVELADRVRAGDLGLGPGLYYVSPLYIYFLAAASSVLQSYTAVRMLQVVLGTASAACIYLMARAWFEARAAWLAFALAAATGLFTFYESLILQSSLDVFLTSAALLALTLALRRDARHWMIVAGLLFGLQSLNRPNVIVAAAAVALALLLARRVRFAALLVAGMLLGIAPVAMRNVVVARQWSLVSSHGGLNFYIGNNESATGFFRAVPGITPNIAGQQSDARGVASRALGRPVTDAEASGHFFTLAWQWIRDHPGDAFSLFARKIGWTLHAQHIALPHSYPFYAHEAQTMLRVLPVGPWLLIPLGLLGLAAAVPAERRAGYLVWASFVPAYTVAVAAFFVAERYRLPLLVPLCVGAGAAIDRVARDVAAKRHAALVIAGLIFPALFMVTNWRHTQVDNGRWEEGLRLAERLVLTGRYDEAEQWVARLEAAPPGRGLAHYAVGLQLLERQRTEDAIRHLTAAQQLDPGQPRIEHALGRALVTADRTAEAVPHLRRAVEQGMPLAVAGYDLALALRRAGDLPAAAQVLGRIEPDPNADIELWLRLGRLASDVKVPDVAEKFFRQASTLRPDHAAARQQYGLNLLVLGRLDDAARELREAVRLDAGNPDSLSHLAFCEYRLGRPDEARRLAAAALAIEPGNQLATQLLAALR